MSNDYLKPSREVHHACVLPDNLDTPIWRYMDFEKFRSILTESALYLCRADRLQDRFEGTYSRQQLISMDNDLKSIGNTEQIAVERESRIRDRKRTYISCWCESDCDLDLMWKAYVSKSPGAGVAIKSTVRRLQKICDAAVELRPLDITLVKYIYAAEGQHINYPGMPNVFFNKDHHFRLDNELRIVYWPNMVAPTPDHVWLPVSLVDLIESVVIAPLTPLIPFREQVRKALDEVNLRQIPVEFSRDRRDLVE